MEGDDAGTRGGKIRHDAVDRLHHQVHVNRGGHAVVAQCLEDHRADGQVRHVVVIHNVEMNDIRTGSEGFRGIFAQPGKISRKN
ncbi:hypothetical protein D3C76_1382330 [compost metagenome]